ncbi:hypothetical protein L195_g032739 [Trifolium pratense]|uniref:CCHC-type domain-containing protein n=1 Tax=Trifolium pratense TaxID=57577 RepID=A0A2K3LE31_TRIPR|nr:hypothetical protein L195_g032739 [Trifolium pratense]
MLHFIGNRIGRTVKVDRTTTTQARGKYARLCVEVDLTKPLLAMFQIKDRYYKVEYEGLHMLCLACGTFGHYKEGCGTISKLLQIACTNRGLLLVILMILSRKRKKGVVRQRISEDADFFKIK